MWRSPSGLHKALNQLRVRRRKLERRELRARHPTDLLTELRLRLAEQFTPHEVQLDAPLGVGVRGGEHLIADAHVDVELFAQLAREARAKRLVVVALAAGKLPDAFEVHAALAPRHEKAAVLLDDRSRYDDCRRHSHSF